MKNWLKRVIPSPKAIHESRYLGIFGKLLHDPNLWHLNRHSVAGAFAVGLFVMYLPPVGHVFIASALAIYLRVNLPIAVALIWISNPVTIPPMFYFAYLVGSWVLGIPSVGFKVHFWLDWHNWFAVLGPLLLGCIICGAVCSLLGYVTIQILWRWKLMRRIQKRKERYRELSESRLRTPSSNRQT
ncbi:DUF2062 domain-containing protein [Thiorhodococcus mannitoliphagus]|uniref:DUF2062 domain-containing protein n=1 Tax=Thiorhodococcus mannitoliphagus TaxID=329406 RepID=A0A6P1DMX6_9GAMM|nr:DUF2062 domain-containing protein [Thiorhodococcus mannitoliphagus]